MLLAVWLLLLAVVFLVPPRISLSPLGIRQPIVEQNTLATGWGHYTTFLKGVLRGVFPHPNRMVDVTEEVGRFGPTSLLLLGLSLSVGALAGAAGALFIRLTRRQSIWELGVFTGMVLPESILSALFWLAALWMIYTWKYKPFPVMWIVDITWRHYVLPVAALAAFPAAYVSRAITTLLDEVSAEMYITVARAKGLSEGQILLQHLLKHAGRSLSSSLPTLLAWSLSALVVVEWIFLIPGLGRSAAFMLRGGNIDPYRMGATLTIFMLIAALLHLACTAWASWLDPREEST